MSDNDFLRPRDLIVLTSVHRYFLENPKAASVNQEELAPFLPSSIALGFVGPILQRLIEAEYLSRGYRDAAIELTYTGLDAVETHAASNLNPEFIPASDRVVQLNDNTPGRVEALTALDEISGILEARPNNLDMKAEDRLASLAEIKSLSERLRSGFIRLGDLISQISIYGLMRTILKQVGSTLIRGLVDRAVAAIEILLKSLQ